MIKNFGFAKYADPDMDEDDLEVPEMGIFEGTVEMEKDETRKRIMDFFY